MSSEPAIERPPVARCENCGRERPGRYCPHCGQNDRDYHRALPPMLGELMRETFEVDGRLLRTLRSLLLHPGELSLEFSKNRRADYVNPVRLYLFASLAFFFVLSMVTEFSPPVEHIDAEELAEAAVSDQQIEALGAVLNERQRERMREILQRQDAPMSKLALAELAREVAEAPPNPAGRYLIGLVVDAAYDPTHALERLVDRLPVAMFAMLPIYAGLLALVYRSRGRYYVEHLVFAVHWHTVAFVAFTLLALLPPPTGRPVLDPLIDLADTAVQFALIGYQYLALKRYYGGSHLATALRLVGLGVLYSMVLLPGIVAALLLALAFD